MPYAAMSADEHDRLTALYGPLTDAVRDFIDVTIHSEADQDTIRTARAAIQAVTETLRTRQRDDWHVVYHAVDGRPTGWSKRRAEAAVERTEGIKTFVSGHLSDSEGITAEAEGIFVQPAWAREI